MEREAVLLIQPLRFSFRCLTLTTAAATYDGDGDVDECASRAASGRRSWTWRRRGRPPGDERRDDEVTPRGGRPALRGNRLRCKI